MVGLPGLLDTLLAGKIPARLDALAIRNEAEIGPPGPVLQVGRVANDVRLPSNAALERLLPGGTGEASPREGGATSSAKAELSATARVISAVLAGMRGDPGPVRGAAPAWASAQVPNVPALARTLSQAVATSGLFYESHLVEFAAGSRTLAQVAQEPQARWAGPALAAALAAEAAPARAGEDASTQPTSAAAAQFAKPQEAASALGAALALPELPAPAPATGGEGAPKAAPAAPAAPTPGAALAADAVVPAPTPAADADPHPDSARLQAAYRWGEAAPAAGADAMVERAGTQDAASPRHVGAAAMPGAPAALPDVIHPQAVALVHQQLDLLATAVFRWNGEAWPGVPMQWSIEHDTEERETYAGDEEALRPWTTTVSMKLPRLGAVDVRLSLAGASVQARLDAAEPDTVARLRSGGGAFAERLSAIGLRLQGFDVSGMERA